MGETITRAGDGMVGPPVLPGTLLRIFNTELTEDTEKRKHEQNNCAARGEIGRLLDQNS